MRLIIGCLLSGCIVPMGGTNCQQVGSFSMVESVWAVDLEDAALRYEVPADQVTCEQVCAVKREGEGVIAVDSVTSCTWDVDPAAADTGELGQLTCSGDQTEENCLG